jgi:hypothetical protein
MKLGSLRCIGPSRGGILVSDAFVSIVRPLQVTQSFRCYVLFYYDLFEQR